MTRFQPDQTQLMHFSLIRSDLTGFGHLHPQDGVHGGPTLTFHAEFPQPAEWRVFIQFQSHGTLHTAALTVHVS